MGADARARKSCTPFGLAEKLGTVEAVGEKLGTVQACPKSCTPFAIIIDSHL